MSNPSGFDPRYGASASGSFTFQAPNIIRFEPATRGWYAWFLNTSAHPVLYKSLTYPTAAHLFEAMKFLESRPEVAEMIRSSARISDAYAIAQRYQQYQHLSVTVTSMMEDVLALKFMQHPDLKAILLNTGDAILKYSDRNDPFWGEGPDGSGRNELGNALMRIRMRIVQANMNARRMLDPAL